MKLDRRQRRAIVLMGLCAGAFTIDRVLLGSALIGSGPASANAASGNADSGLATLAEQAKMLDQLSRTKIRPSDLNDRVVAALEMVDIDEERESLADAFQMPVTWRPVVLATSESKSVVDAPTFQMHYRLTAVLESDNELFAVVNGRPVLVGQMIDGATLTDVVGRSAIFEINGRVITLKLDPIP